jgi:integrase
MQEKRIVVWVQRFKDRDSLMLQWIDPDTGKRKSQSAGTNHPGVAEMKKTELEYELNHGLHKEASRMSWEKFRELFEAEYVSGCRPNTRQNYADTFASFEKLSNPGSLKGITERTLSAWVGALRKEGRQESTIKVRLQFMHTALAWAVKQKLIPECPQFPSARPPKRKPQPVPVESFERLLDKAEDDNMRTFLLCGWLAGLRLKEACELEWEETDKAPYIDLARERIVFPAGFVKGVEDQWVPLDSELREALLELPRHGKKVFRFVDRRSGKLRNLPRSIIISHRVSKMARQAGVRLTMKSLRRGFGCYWASRVPAQVLQKLMRHANIKTTMDYYVNVDDAAMQAIRGRQPSLRNSEPKPEAKAKAEEQS